MLVNRMASRKDTMQLVELFSSTKLASINCSSKMSAKSLTEIDECYFSVIV